MKESTYQKEFTNIIKKLAMRHSCWQVWNDFLTMTTISMANVAHVVEKEERELEYHKVRNRYSEQELEEFTKLLGFTIQALEHNPEQDFFGELYHALHLEQQQKGQFFTPYHICQFMSSVVTDMDSINRELESKGYISVSDPACGSGAMLVAFANTMKNNLINYQEQVLFVAQDIDYTAAMMCYVQLSLLGCSAIIIIGDSLAKPGFHPDNEVWYTPMYYLNWQRFRTTEETESDESELRVPAGMKTVWEETENGQYSFTLESAS